MTPDQTKLLPITTRTHFLPDSYGIFAVALSAIILAHSTVVGMLSILVLYALWFPQVLLRPRQVLQPFGIAIFLCLLPLLCTYSFFWSYAPNRSIYFGIQFFTMVLCTIIIARTVRVEALLKGLTLGCFLVLGASVLSGNYQQDYFTKAYSLFGYFSSKNQIGLFADVSIFISLLLIFGPIPARDKIIYGLLPLVLGAIALYLCKSAASVLSLAAVIGATLAAYVITRFPRGLRPVLMVIGLLFIATVFAYLQAFSLDVQGATLQGLGKDSTLTGRTYLWSEGLRAALDHPWLGWGYSGFWAPGQPLAERYWAEFGVLQRNGFHFHNSYIQTFVDVGIIGLLLAISLILINVILSLRRLLRDSMTFESSFAFGFAVMFFVRALVEVDFLGQFSIGTMLVFIIIPLLTRQPDTQART